MHQDKTRQTAPALPVVQSSTFPASASSSKVEKAASLMGISELLESQSWKGIIRELASLFGQHHHSYIEAMADKDLYVTEAIRHAVVPSELYPEARVVFKGGTSLAKAQGIINRFSEDIDVNIIPSPGQPFGDSRRKKIRKELQARLEAGLPLPMRHIRHGGNFAKTIIAFQLVSAVAPSEMTEGEVLVEMNIRSQPPDTWMLRPVTSLAGEIVSRLDPGLANEYPILKPFEVLTADPLIAVIDKLDALHWRSSSDDPEQVRFRARDIYDLACLLRHDSVRPRLNSELTAAMHEFVVASNPPGLANRAIDRPADGFAASPVFQPGHPANAAIRNAYPRLRHLVYSDEYWIDFDDAIAIIHDSSNLI